MNKKAINEVTVETVRQVYDGSHIDNDLILFDEIAHLPLPAEPRRMGCKFVALCTQGRAQYSVDTEEHTVSANDIIIINEGQVTDDYMLSRDCSGVAIMVSGDFFSEIVKGVHELSQLFLFTRTHPVSRLTQQEADDFLTFFKIIKQKTDEGNHHFLRQTVCALMETMIYDLSNVIYRVQRQSDRRQTRAETIFTGFLQLVEQHFRAERRVGWYAQQLCISPKYLSETVKQVSRRTPNEWIDSYVALEIRVQLRNSTRSIKEIAHDLHFPNQSFLGKYFKEHVGMSPSQYRRS